MTMTCISPRHGTPDNLFRKIQRKKPKVPPVIIPPLHIRPKYHICDVKGLSHLVNTKVNDMISFNLIWLLHCRPRWSHHKKMWSEKKNEHYGFLYLMGIEEHRKCFGLGGYFMAPVLAAACYSKIGFSPCLALRTRRVRVPGGSTFHLEPGKIKPFWNLTGTWCIWWCQDFLLIVLFSIRDRGGGDFSAVIPPV